MAHRKIKKKSLLEAAHDMACGLHKVGAIDVTTMREFDALCLPEVKELDNEEIKEIREQQKVSQAIFAVYLNTSVSTVRQWEQGERHPSGPSLRLLNIVAKKGLEVMC